ncbi:hypothetical protein [Virgibacillus oceani]|uniref:DUF4375 domain-containing protein n=1 Tax=Virgibacillus oceani TaxID=1479511 RepID=A0A917M0D4_9BACI|nr:hypothetical protein [Virgibacillus oceani]GGG69165.1 hypothetical protein GCM10011398_11460 [Virgibacillus oceani]
MENKYGKKVTPVHKFMRYFIDHNKNIPLQKLIDKKYDHSLFRPLLAETEDYVLQHISYIHAGSFVTYLIDTYGLDKFEQLYNKSEPENRLTEIYGMTTVELENEWIQYIKKNITFTSDDRLELDSFYIINSEIDSIDPEIFEKE